MKCLVKSKFETGIVSVEDINLLHFLKNPSNKPKKELPLWRFITLKEGAEKRANQELYDTIHVLIVEFDHVVSIQTIEELASEYSYAIHTTSSHTQEAHRFRLMLPLDISYPESFWRLENVKKAMELKFPGLDRSCFINYQCIPALPANPSDYYYKIQGGRKFGYKEIEKIVESLEFDEQIERQFKESLYPTTPLSDVDRVFDLDRYIEKHVIGRLDEVDWNCDGCGRNNAIVSMCGTWKTKAKHEGRWILAPILQAVEQYRLPAEFIKTARKKLR